MFTVSFSVESSADGLQKFDLDRISECLDETDASSYSDYDSCAHKALEKCQKIEKYRLDQCLYIANDSWVFLIESALNDVCKTNPRLCKKAKNISISYRKSMDNLCDLFVDRDSIGYMQRVEYYSCSLDHLIFHALYARNLTTNYR